MRALTIAATCGIFAALMISSLALPVNADDPMNVAEAAGFDVPVLAFNPPLIEPNAGGYLDILICHADIQSYGEPLRSQLQAFPEVNTVDTYNAHVGTPALATLQAYDIVFTYCWYGYFDSNAMGNVLADYVDGGGKAVMSVFDWFGDTWWMQGRMNTDGLNPFISTGVGDHWTYSDLGAFDATHPIMTGITTATASSRDYVNLQPGATLIASWADGEEFIAEKGNVVAINAHFGHYWYTHPNGGQMWDIVHNTVIYLGYKPIEVVSRSALNFVPVLPMGSLVYQAFASSTIPNPDDGRAFTCTLDGGQMLTFTMDAAPGLQPRWEVRADGLIIASGEGADGACVRWTGTFNDDTNWEFRCVGAAGTTGDFTVHVALNAMIENEGTVNGPTTNDVLANAEPIDDSFVSPGYDSMRGAVMGVGNGFSTTTNTYVSTDVPRLIPPGAPGSTAGTTNSIVVVPDIFIIYDVNLVIGSLTHTWDADLDMYLIGPGGTPTVELSTDNGANGDNYIGTTFDDEAATSIVSGVAPFTGSYRPEGSLSAFDGLNSAGTWTLRIIDDAGGDWGTLTSWSLVLESSHYDMYSFPVNEDDVIDISVKLLSGMNIDISLYSPGGILLVSGIGGVTNVERSISQHAATATGDYYVRVRADGEYNIVVTLNCHFNLEPNEPLASAWLLSPTYRYALGHVTSANRDSFRFDLTAGQPIDTYVYRPGSREGKFVNTMVPIIAVYDQWQLLGKAATLIPGDDIVRMTYTPMTTGAHYFEISTLVGGGEYFLYINQYPVAVDDTVNIDEDTVANSIYPLGNDYDPDGDLPLEIYNWAGAYHGYAELVSPTEIQYTPSADYFGWDEIRYWVRDQAGGWGDAYIYINVVNVQDAPVAQDDEYRVMEDSVDNEFDLLENDYDVDHDTITIVGVSMVLSGTVTIGGGGAYLLYTPWPGFYGDDAFTYTITDGNGNTDTATVTVHVVKKALPAIEQPSEMEQPPIAEKGSESSATMNVIVADIVLLAIMFVLLVAVFRRREYD